MLCIGDAALDCGVGAEIDMQALRKRVAVRDVNLAHADNRNQQLRGFQVGAPGHTICFAANDRFQSVNHGIFRKRELAVLEALAFVEIFPTHQA